MIGHVTEWKLAGLKIWWYTNKYLYLHMNELKELMKSMDIPDERRVDGKNFDIRWLLRNLGIRNSSNENYIKCISILKQMLKENK